jgi:uncharacterized cupin superfamily protein
VTQRTNILTIELDERLDEAGFRHVAAAVGVRLGAQRIRASVYEAEAGVPIWPYHYHHGVEEWLYVIAGAPVLREPAGERTLTLGDLVCFPSGHLGAHTVSGPGRFLLFSTGHDAEPWMSVYPDSDKISGPGGVLLRTSAVDYWHGEGTAGPSSEPVEFAREPTTSPPQPMVNVLAPPESGRLGPRLGADRLDATVADIDPGAGSDPYHYVYGREEWLLVLAGTPTVRVPAGERPLAAGDLVCFPEGPAGAHRLINRSDSPVRVLLLSTTGLPANVCLPDTGQWVIHNGDEVTAYVEARRGTVRAVTDPVFRLVAPASALEAAPAGWARELLRQGEMALALDGGDLDAIDAVARALERPAVSVLRRESTPVAAEASVREFAAGLALVWIAPTFGDDARAWARDRAPMTLLVEHDGPLPEEERRRIERFVAILGRQAE